MKKLIAFFIVGLILLGWNGKVDVLVDSFWEGVSQITETLNIENSTEADDNHKENSDNNFADESYEDREVELKITVLDVGQGLSVLVESDNAQMLYDGGDRETSSYVVAYLEEHDIDDLEMVIASHYDADHISGLVGVLDTTPVDFVLAPNYKTDTKIFQSFQRELEENNINLKYPEVGDEFYLGDSKITVLAPAKDYDDPNEMSVVIKIEYEDFSCIITGDAEYESEMDMLRSGIDLDSDVYVVGHHGSSSSSNKEFVKKISPEYALISCGKDNSYGHPHDEVLDVLENENATIYRTDYHGEIYCYSDGENCWFAIENQ